MEVMFSIRPQPKKEESLTAYLCRLAKRNEISFLEMWKLINTGPKSKVRTMYGYKLDIIPHEVIDASVLSKLLRTSKSQIENMTFFPIIKKFFDNQGSVGEVYNYTMNNEIIREKRRFCPKCLKEHGVFKLIWQVRGIEICDIHHVSLKTSCSNCLEEQPYISEALAFLTCHHCKTALDKTNDEEITNKGFIMDQLHKYADWRYLLNSGTELVTKKEIEGLTREKALAMKFLFVAQGQQREFKNSSVKNLSRDKVRNLVGLLCNRSRRQKVFIQDLFQVLKAEHLSVEQFAKTRVVPSYTQSFLSQSPGEKEPGICFAPWCLDRGNRKSIIEIAGEGHHLKYKHKYSSSWICLSCFMRYGYSRNTRQWENIGEEINIIGKVKTYLELGKTREKIRKVLNLGFFRLNEIFGYLLYHELLPDHYSRIFRPISKNNLIIERFDDLKNCTRDSQNMYKVARSLFNWNQVTFFYYYNSREVKYLLLKESSQRKVSARNKEKRHGEAQLSINSMVQGNVGVKVKDLAVTLDLSENTLRYHGINVIAKEISLEQRKINLQQEQVKLTNVAGDYIKLKLERREVIYTKDIYKILGRSRKFIKSNFPILFQWISDQIRLSKIYQNQLKEELIMILIRNAFEVLLIAGNKVTEKAVSSEMKFGYNIFSRSKYREMYDKVKVEMNLW